MISFTTYQSVLKTLLKNHKSCSLISQDGQLLYSKDSGLQTLTTTRLVAFQIIKKYLSPKPLDFFILNDPENGGYTQAKIIFVTCLANGLFLIWDDDTPLVNFKIPPTPLFDQGKKNEFVWQALLGACSYPAELEVFLEYHRFAIDRINHLKDALSTLANTKYQNQWLKASDAVFASQFDSKAHGTYEAQHAIAQGGHIRMKFTAEEKQNLRLITLDFTNTQTASATHAASHVIESALLKKICDFYQLSDFFTQSVIDKIKIILPPKSIVSKPHSMGEHNFELQCIAAQMCDFNLVQLNSHSRRPQTQFDYLNFLLFEISAPEQASTAFSTLFLSPQHSYLQNFESLVEQKLIRPKKMRKHEAHTNLSFEVTTDNLQLDVKNNYSCNKSVFSIRLNQQVLAKGPHRLKLNDIVDIIAN